MITETKNMPVLKVMYTLCMSHMFDACRSKNVKLMLMYNVKQFAVY